MNNPSPTILVTGASGFVGRALIGELLRDDALFTPRELRLYDKVPLPDDLREVYTKFGIDLVRFNGSDAWTLPLPGRFILDRRGVLKDVQVNPDYTKRPEPGEIIALLKSQQL